jgi:AAA domain, putative AbiEii toxin, Type IV TA system
VGVLLRFRVANHRSIRADHDLSLVATEFNEGTARLTGVRAEGREVGVVPVAGIFGANASGKSNVLAAFRAMREAVRSSLADWAQEAGVPREPFVLDPAARDDTTLFEVDLLLGERPVRYTYGFELSDERVEAEWLHVFPHGRSRFGSTARPSARTGTSSSSLATGCEVVRRSSRSSLDRTRSS